MNWRRIFLNPESEEEVLVQVRKFEAVQGIDWISCGWRRFGKDLESWMLMALFYLAGALVLVRVPFMGVLILVFLTPLLMAGTLITAEELSKKSERKKNGHSSRLKQSLRHQFTGSLSSAARGLFRVFSHDDKIFPILQISMIAVGLTLLVQFAVGMIAGAVLLDTVQIGQIGAIQGVQIMVALLAAVSLYFLLAVLFVFAIPLCALGEATVLGGIYYSYRAVAQNWRPFLVYLIVLSIPPALAILCASLLPMAGLVIALIIGCFSFPIIVNSNLCCYKLIYRGL